MCVLGSCGIRWRERVNDRFSRKLDDSYFGQLGVKAVMILSVGPDVWMWSPPTLEDFSSEQNSANCSVILKFWDNVPQKKPNPVRVRLTEAKSSKMVYRSECRLNCIMVATKQTKVANIAVYSQPSFQVDYCTILYDYPSGNSDL